MSKDNARIETRLVFGSAKPYGSSRSIVRRIATSLPLKPCPRVQFQLNPYGEDDGGGRLRAPSRQSFLVASLADIGLIDREDEDEDDEDCFDRPRPGLSTGLVFRLGQPQPPTGPMVRRRSLPSLHQGDPDPQGPATVSNEAIQKISALETELAKLRVQIAQIVLAQEKSTQSAPAAGIPPPPQAPSAPPPPPPPPPPPLPPLGPGLPRTFSAMDLIKERRGKKLDGGQAAPEPKAAPSMLDVLKDMGKVKLRAVNRGGGRQAKASEPMDAVSLIAEALKRKFAHRHRHDSGTEEDDGGGGEFKLPIPDAKPRVETPLFGQHMLKPTANRKVV